MNMQVELTAESEVEEEREEVLNLRGRGGLGKYVEEEGELVGMEEGSGIEEAEDDSV